MSARNTKGYGPLGSVVSFTTAPGVLGVNKGPNQGRANLVEVNPRHQSKNHENGISPIVLYAIFGVGAGIILVLVVGVFIVIKYKCQANGAANENRGNKTYHVAEAVANGTREKLNPPPPDLWIGHDQLELKDLSDEASASAICDETGETTLTRSTPDYRATMERTRNYIQNSQYSGESIFVPISLNAFCFLYRVRSFYSHFIVHFY